METIINNGWGSLMPPLGAEPENSVLDDKHPRCHDAGLRAQDTRQK